MATCMQLLRLCSACSICICIIDMIWCQHQLSSYCLICIYLINNRMYTMLIVLHIKIDQFHPFLFFQFSSTSQANSWCAVVLYSAVCTWHSSPQASRLVSESFFIHSLKLQIINPVSLFLGNPQTSSCSAGYGLVTQSRPGHWNKIWNKHSHTCAHLLFSPEHALSDFIIVRHEHNQRTGTFPF